MTLSDQLADLADSLDRMTASGKVSSIQKSILSLEKSAKDVGKAWSGSPLGYHSTIYYDGLKTPPPDALFDPEWGLMDAYFSNRTCGNWIKFNPDEVRVAIYSRAGNPDMAILRKFDTDALNEFNDCKMSVLSILQVAMTEPSDAFLAELNDKVDKLFIISNTAAAKTLTPRGQFMSRDTAALSQGIKLPPHLEVLAEVVSLKNTLEILTNLARITKQASKHISRQEAHRMTTGIRGTKVFIGHGRSPLWRELKDFIVDRLNLPVDEFNRVPVAGITNIDRLREMLDTASIAFLLMTGEDEQLAGNFQPRMNVVHEAGLFQGRLGFRRAIIVLEEECEEFSNIEGLGQIRFTKGNIKEAFEDIRQLLEREGLYQVVS